MVRRTSSQFAGLEGDLEDLDFLDAVAGGEVHVFRPST